MFTGLIETTGVFVGIAWQGKAGKFSIDPAKHWSDLTNGESIAVNGTCLTLEQVRNGILTFHVMRETFSKTNLGDLKSGDSVNLERALCAGGRLGGHLVSGHVDATADVVSFGRKGSDLELRIALPPELKNFIVLKGSICINGVSLTVSDLTDEDFAVSLIPTTERETNLKFLSPGCKVNLEADMIAKYVCARLDAMGLSLHEKKNITMDDLHNAGF